MKYFFFLILIITIFIYYKKNKILIQNDNIIFKNLSESYNLESLIHDLIKKNIDDISKIEKCYNIFGYLKVIQNRPYVLISNGKIDYYSLIKTRKTIKYLKESLDVYSLKLNQVLYAIYLNDNLYVVKN